MNELVENNQYTLTPQEFVTSINKDLENGYPQIPIDYTTEEKGKVIRTQYDLAKGAKLSIYFGQRI
jgi:hypothetical protein